jgi:hypothetical protein
MNLSETEGSSVSPPRFQFALWQLMAGTILVGGGVVYSPIGTLVLVGIGLYIGFTVYGPRPWKEIAIVFAIGFPLFMVIIGVFSSKARRGPVRLRPAALFIDGIEAALARYHVDYGAYPPDILPNASGAESLAHYLCESLQKDGIQSDPFLQYPSEFKRDSDGNGVPELKTVWGHDYIYALRSNGKPLVIDRGPDGLPGGTINFEKGFVPDRSDANGDGVADDKDNLYSHF